MLRGLALTAALATRPLPSGDALLLEVFSPHLDVHQRLLVMQALATAAQVRARRALTRPSPSRTARSGSFGSTTQTRSSRRRGAGLAS